MMEMAREGNGDAGSQQSLDQSRDSESGRGDKSLETISTTDNPKSATEESKTGNLAAAENASVLRLKLLVLFVLICSTIVVSWAVHHYVSKAEKDDFESQFKEDAQKVLSTIGGNIERTMEAMDALSVSMVSFARATNQTWPFVIIPDFGVRAEKIRALSGAVYVTTYHFVESEQRDEWEAFTGVPENFYWVNETIELMDANPVNPWPIVWNWTYWDVIHGYDEWDKAEPGVNGTNHTGPYLPLWHIMPMIPYDPPFNWDLNTVPDTTVTDNVISGHKVALSSAYLVYDPTSSFDQQQEDEDEAAWISDYLTTDEDPMSPISDYYFPVIDNSIDSLNLQTNYSTEENKVVAMLAISVYWRDALKDILPPGSEGIIVVFENECNPTFTYEINGAQVRYVGAGDGHQTKYDYLAFTSWVHDLQNYAFAEQSYSGRPLVEDVCPFLLSIYPSSKMEDSFTSKNPMYLTMAAAFIFLFTSLVFVIYDYKVESRHTVVNTTAVRSTAIVNSLFPKAVQKRVAEEVIQGQSRPSIASFTNAASAAFQLEGNGEDIKGMPIAELFPQTTIIFADLVGFTAWSSARDPSQVFTLLETLYGGFDRIARKRKVFKVETIGDCYVAVVGLPNPNPNHAVVMSRFSNDIRDQMKITVKKLEKSLGPGTAELTVRIGLHSGPTTAGVLRGEKARFQLFGDTINMASRMESTGTPGMIHVSRKTADLLRQRKKGHWLTKRDDLVAVKGKGMLQTFWVEPMRSSTSNEFQAAEAVAPEESIDDTEASKMDVLVDWNISVLEGLLEEIAAHRITLNLPSEENVVWASPAGGTIDEVAATIDLSTHIPTDQAYETKGHLSGKVKHQLRDYVQQIAGIYSRHAKFHNLEHSSHVMMSVVKLLSRITTKVARTSQEFSTEFAGDYAIGISSDPLAKFCIAFSALIHDVDHPGVPNEQLIREKSELAELYQNKCIAEQNSIDLAWDMLMEPAYDELRAAIYATQAELKRFRQIVVNSVLATDLFDTQLEELREERWNAAFANIDDVSLNSEQLVENSNLRATVVLEYVIQASDIAHTMQHWHVYRQWNKRLFSESYVAYKEGRAVNDPSETWYRGELAFFENYAIPIAKKLKECEVFGVGCDEFYDLACENRLEWEEKGPTIVEEMRLEAESDLNQH